MWQDDGQSDYGSPRAGEFVWSADGHSWWRNPWWFYHEFLDDEQICSCVVAKRIHIHHFEIYHMYHINCHSLPLSSGYKKGPGRSWMTHARGPLMDLIYLSYCMFLSNQKWIDKLFSAIPHGKGNRSSGSPELCQAEVSEIMPYIGFKMLKLRFR